MQLNISYHKIVPPPSTTIATKRVTTTTTTTATTTFHELDISCGCIITYPQ